MPPESSTETSPLVWLHVGDLHITEPGLENHTALQQIVAQVNNQLTGQIDFVYLPGDNADQGSAAQYRLVRDAIDALRVPVRIIPGDHDVEPGSLDAYHAVLGAETLPAAHTLAGRRCLFLDIVSAGSGGPDFRIGERQFSWLEDQLQQAARDGQRVALFMHSYPADLGVDSARFLALLDRFPVSVIDMGHTHYNELANDGSTIYAATRSTGQIEEGEAGFSIVALDGGVVSWRFKPLDGDWPLVMITAPADRRLSTASTTIPHGPITIRARVLGASGIASVSCQIGAEPAVAMTVRDGIWTIDWTPSGDGEHRITVRALSDSGSSDSDSIIVVTGEHDGQSTAPSSGSDAHTIGAWPDRHVFGTQLGPNRNGRKW